jgi:thiamine pyrophosphokinase
MSQGLVVVVSGGDPPAAQGLPEVPRGVPVLAADGGLAHARTLGLHVTTVVGDLDSVAASVVAEAEADGVAVLRFPAEKDATDLELALDAALELRPARVLVLAGDGGRLDHLLGSLLLLGSSRYADTQLDAVVGGARLNVVRHESILESSPGELVSLVALHGPAEGVSTEGLRYPLVRETLEPGSTRGISNVFLADTARVTVERGVLLAIRPPASHEAER